MILQLVNTASGSHGKAVSYEPFTASRRRAQCGRRRGKPDVASRECCRRGKWSLSRLQHTQHSRQGGRGSRPHCRCRAQPHLALLLLSLRFTVQEVSLFGAKRFGVSVAYVEALAPQPHTSFLLIPFDHFLSLLQLVVTRSVIQGSSPFPTQTPSAGGP